MGNTGKAGIAASSNMVSLSMVSSNMASSTGQLTQFRSWFLILIIISLATLATGCASSPQQAAEDQSSAASSRDSKQTASTDTPSTATAPTAPAEEKTIAAPGAVLLTPVEILSYDDRSVPKRAKNQPDEVIKFCVAQPYAKHKKQVLNGINDAWEKTKAGKYGVGFRNKKEYNKWNKIQQDFFLYMFDACRTVALCEIQSKKDKKKNACTIEHARFNAWQASAKKFAENVKSFENGQPPSLCGLLPSDKDASLCFDRRAEQIEQSCGDACLELSQCWRNVAIKDDVIRQAESSCGFTGQKLSQCSGYIGATQNRKTQFKECNSLQSGLKLSFQP